MNWKLNDQICFLLYSSSREIIKNYKKLLDPLELTYTQYVTMIALWEQDHVSVSDLGKRLALDSGTLTPLLKKLESDGRISRKRDHLDERKVWIDLTEKGRELAKKAEHIPYEMYRLLEVQDEDAKALYDVLTKINQERLLKTTGEENE